MGIRSAIVRRLGRDLLADVAEQARTKALTEAAALARVAGPKAVEKALAEASVGDYIDPDEHLWRSLTASNRDLPQVTHERAVEVCYTLYQQNPLGHRVTELNRDFVVGDGVTWSAQNPAVEDIVGEWWTDDHNDLPERVNDFALELGLYGELCIQAIPGQVSGFVQLDYIDPGQIKAVVPVDGRTLLLDKVRIRKKGFGLRGQELKIIRRRDGRLSGDVFFTKINSVSNSTRGWPDLLHIADWLDAYDQFLWEVLERARHIRSYVWDVLVKGLNEADLPNKLRQIQQNPPRSGSVRVHNENEIWDAVAPQLQSFEMAKEGEVLLEHIAAGAGFPKTWLASAEDVNRATAREMGTPTDRRLAARQQKFLRVLHRMVRFVLEEASEAGRLKGLDSDGTMPVYADGVDTGERAHLHELVKIHAPEISPRDVANTGTLMQSLAQALAIAETKGWFGKAESRQILALALAHLGYEAGKELPAAPPEEATPELTPVPSEEEPASSAA